MLGDEVREFESSCSPQESQNSKSCFRLPPVVNADFKVAARLKTAETVPVELPPS